MKSFRSLMGRRQFLLAAGAASTLGLGLKKQAVAGIRAIGPDTALAAEKTNSVGKPGQYSSRYSHLLSPFKIGDVVLKNRFMQCNSYPFYMQGPENFPSEQVISWYSNVAKNGCAIVMVWKGKDPSEDEGGSHGGMAVWDKSDVKCQNYFAQLTDAIHFHGSKAAITMSRPASTADGYSIGGATGQMPFMPGGMSQMPGGKGDGQMSGGMPQTGGGQMPEGMPQMPGGMGDAEEAPVEYLQKIIDDLVAEAKLYKTLGFDMVYFHMSYQRYFLSTTLSPLRNVRKDQYGGSVENRARFCLELFQAIKKACGPNFLIGAHVSGEEDADGGYTIQDLAQYAKIWEGALDILVVRGKNDNVSHASPFNFDYSNNPILKYAETLKASGTRMVISPNGGFQDLDYNDEIIASGKADLITMARCWWADPEYGKKAYEGRGEDVAPCVRCNDCHGLQGRPHLTFCAVNPQFTHAHRMNRMIDPPEVSRKVAVIGGGPAGMKAAITAAARGHQVTLFERMDALGGQLRHTDFAAFKWTYRDHKDYLIRQVEKSGIDVNLKTRVTPEMIRKKGFDAVVAATGAAPIIPEIPGADGNNVLAPIYAYNNKTLGKKIVVIGGEQIGTETGMYLAENGHDVTILTSQGQLASDANGIYLSVERWGHLENFSYITGVTAKRISKDKVTYVDAAGDEKSIQADNVVIYAGRRPRQTEAMEFCGAADRFFMVGDCSHDGDIVNIIEGNLRTSLFTAFAAASKI